MATVATTRKIIKNMVKQPEEKIILEEYIPSQFTSPPLSTSTFQPATPNITTKKLEFGIKCDGCNILHRMDTKDHKCPTCKKPLTRACLLCGTGHSTGYA